MADLILRAEQGVLGALLRNPDQPTIVDNLHADDFGHDVHRAVYRALIENEPPWVINLDERIAVVVAVAETDVDPQWLHAIADAIVADELVPEYARIVVRAAFERDLTGFAEPYQQAAALADDPVTRDGLLRLADVLDTQVAFFGEPAAIDPAFDIVLTGQGVEADVPFILEPEDQVIADILQHPEQAREVAAWLDSELFTTGRRRHTFEFAVSLAYDNEPFDSVTLAWNINRAQNHDRYSDPEQTEPAPIDADHQYVTRLYGATIVPGTAVVVGRDLLTAHVQARHQTAATASTQRTMQIEQTPTAPQLGMQPPLSQEPATDIRPIEL